MQPTTLSVLVGLTSIASVSLVEAATINGDAEVVDGDTIKVGGLPVRLHGIDAPEGLQTCERGGTKYDCGKQATKVLANLIGGKSVQCEILGKDDFGRILGTCAVGDTELNSTMVSSGWAVAFRKFSATYVAAEQEARRAQAGLWSGSFDMPSDWRLGKAQSVEAASEQGCVIKGNVGRGGERIYHLPFQQFYSRTKISKSKGERWFCTEQEAQAAGWRRALR